MNQFTCSIVPVLFLLSSPTPSLLTFKPSPPLTTIQTKANVKGWDVNVTNVRYLGPVVQGKYELYEAADTWIAVTVTCTNTTGKRQRTDDEPVSSIFAELIDNQGNKHDVDERELKYEADLLSKPYAPNEARTEVWLFDVPQGTRASQLVIENVRFQL